MKQLWMILSVVLGTAGLLGAETPSPGIQWLEDWDLARKKAQTEGKDLLVYFSGSDWCTWCQKLDQEVLSKKAFFDGTKDGFIYFRADFPQALPQDPKVIKQNQELQRHYQVEGYPTLLVVPGKGPSQMSSPIGKTGYLPGGPAVFTGLLQGFRKSGPELAGIKDKAGFAKLLADQKGDFDRGAKIDGLYTLAENQSVELYYKEDLIKALEPLNSQQASPFKSKFKLKMDLERLIAQWNDTTDWRKTAIPQLDALVKQVEETAYTAGKAGFNREIFSPVVQDVLIVKASILVQVLQAREEGIRSLEEAYKKAPGTRFGRTAQTLIAQLRGQQ